MPIPAPVEVHQAAALPEAACTVWSNLEMTAHLSAGQTLLIHGGASGVGAHGIQVAHALDVRVAVTEIRLGIIPAYAGSTQDGTSWERPDGDHPRIRGEHPGS